MKCTCNLVFLLPLLLLINSNASDQTQQPVINQITECFRKDSVSIIIRDGTDNYIDIIVAKSNYFNGKCIYDSVHAIFESKQNWETFYLDFKYPYLFLDSGTGPDPRGLTIIDVILQKTVLSTGYSDPIEFIDSSTISYWSERNDTEKCEECAKWAAQGLGCAIEDKVLYNFRTQTITTTKESRCASRQ